MKTKMIYIIGMACMTGTLFGSDCRGLFYL